MIRSGYIYVRATSAYEAVCRAWIAKSAFWHDEFRIHDLFPLSVQRFAHGRYDFVLAGDGDWRVLVMTKGGDVPAEVMARLRALDWFLDLRVYAEGEGEEREAA